MKAPKGGWKLQLHSQHYLRVWFKDGNEHTFYSLDWRHKYAPFDPSLGVKRLQNLVRKYGERANGAIIYSKHTRQAVEEYYEGELIQSALSYPISSTP